MIKETFYRDADGKLYLRAIESVGATNAVSFAKHFRWRTNGYPKGRPSDLGRGTIWAAYDAELKTGSTK